MAYLDEQHVARSDPFGLPAPAAPGPEADGATDAAADARKLSWTERHLPSLSKVKRMELIVFSL